MSFYMNLLVKVIEILCLDCLGSYYDYKINIKGIKSREKFRVITCFEPDGSIMKPVNSRGVFRFVCQSSTLFIAEYKNL